LQQGRGLQPVNMTREPSAAYSRWYKENISHTVDCPICGHPLQILAVDSSGHEIVEPCWPCHLTWRADQIAKSEQQTKICDECGGKLRVLKDGRKKCTRRKCGMEYL